MLRARAVITSTRVTLERIAQVSALKIMVTEVIVTSSMKTNNKVQIQNHCPTENNIIHLSITTVFNQIILIIKKLISTANVTAHLITCSSAQQLAKHVLTEDKYLESLQN